VCGFAQLSLCGISLRFKIGRNNSLITIVKVLVRGDQILHPDPTKMRRMGEWQKSPRSFSRLADGVSSKLAVFEKFYFMEIAIFNCSYLNKLSYDLNSQ